MSKYYWGALLLAIAGLAFFTSAKAEEDEVALSALPKYAPCVSVAHVEGRVKSNSPDSRVEIIDGPKLKYFMFNFNRRMVRSSFWADQVMIITRPGSDTFRIILVTRECVVVNSYFPMNMYRAFMGNAS